MKIEDQINRYREYNQETLLPRESKIQETINASMERFLQEEANKTLSYKSFLYIQFKLIQKRWWLSQFLLLVLLWIILPYSDDIIYSYRSMGVAGALFIILIIPELWKNRMNNCMEIESATYYSLRQIYSARILLFGIVDMILVTIFCIVTTFSLEFSLTELLIQFLFPMLITACICFGILCNKYAVNEPIAISLCIFWSVIWWAILANDELYSTIVIPMWIVLFVLAIILLCFFVYRTIHQCNKIWEVNFDENGNN